MLSSTNAAISGSRIAQPVMVATATPTRTPADVKTSVSRCRPSATKAGERCRCPDRIRMNDQSALIRLAASLSTKPFSGASNGFGCKNPRWASRRIENATRRQLEYRANPNQTSRMGRSGMPSLNPWPGSKLKAVRRRAASRKHPRCCGARTHRGHRVHRSRLLLLDCPMPPMPPMPLDLIGRTLRRTACQRFSNIRMGNSKLSGNM
jgi:hypothetical protein